MKTTLSFLAALLVFAGGMIGTTTTANAQRGYCVCPNIENWYPSIPWSQRSDTIIYTVGGGICTTQVCYCYREMLTAPIVEIFLCSFKMIPSVPCSGFGSMDVRNIELHLTRELILQDPGDIFPPCPECPYENTNYRTFNAACKTGGVYCNQITAACVISFSFCCVDGVPRLTETGRQFIGTCPSGCEPESCYGNSAIRLFGFTDTEPEFFQHS